MNSSQLTVHRKHVSCDLSRVASGLRFLVSWQQGGEAETGYTVTVIPREGTVNG
ncbi:MAG: hypothetical protein V1736_01025 [Pseudomonadota bacterium]